MKSTAMYKSEYSSSERAAPASSPSAPMVCVDGVNKWFGQDQVLRNISVEIKDGEFFSLLGPSGCGKTTLMRIIAGFEFPTEGTILIDQRSVVDVPASRRPTNMVFQHFALFPHMSIEKNIAFGLEMKRVPRSTIATKVKEALALVRLEKFSGRKIDELSGGQKQRVAIARALVNEPKVLLLDEPLGALDLQLRLQMQGELARIQRATGSTFIFVTHDQAEAMTMSDRIAVMDRGEILQVGTPRDIYERPTHRFVAEFIGHSNFFEGVVCAGASINEYCPVSYDGVELVGRGAVPLEVGTKVAVMVRYENLQLLAAPENGRLVGNVTNKIFTGPTVRTDVLLANGKTVTSEQPVSSDAVNLGVGQAVGIHWTAANAVVLNS